MGRELLCRIGMHHWREWQDTSVGLIPIGERNALNEINAFSAEGVDMETLSLETKHRECRHCGHIQVRQFVRW